jgi:hypothetical protein
MTYSVYIKRKTGTGKIYITADSGSTWVEKTIPTTTFGRFSVTAASASQTCGIKIETSGDAIYVYGNQFENAPYASPLIPTTNGALTRNAPTYRYENYGNRTAATESIHIKFTALGSDFANDGAQRTFLSNDTKTRTMRKEATGTVIKFFPNLSDSGTAGAQHATTPVKNTSYVVCGIAVGATGNPNTTIYQNADNAVSDNADWTSPAWGDYFYVGSSSGGAVHLGGIIEKVAIFSKAQSIQEVSTAYTNLQRKNYADAVIPAEGGGEEEVEIDFAVLLEDSSYALLESGDVWLLEN